MGQERGWRKLSCLLSREFQTAGLARSNIVFVESGSPEHIQVLLVHKSIFKSENIVQIYIHFAFLFI